jgi:hypothetical protein
MRDWRGGNKWIVIFASSGIAGPGAWREWRDPKVEHVVSIVRAPTGTTPEKLREILHNNFLNFAPIAIDRTPSISKIQFALRVLLGPKRTSSCPQRSILDPNEIAFF